jgi:hypothetical protein
LDGPNSICFHVHKPPMERGNDKDYQPVLSRTDLNLPKGHLKEKPQNYKKPQKIPSKIKNSAI